MIRNSDYMSVSSSLGNMLNTGKRYFLQLATKCISKVNQIKYDNEIPYAIKSIIRCGPAIVPSEFWSVSQLSGKLQKIN